MEYINNWGSKMGKTNFDDISIKKKTIISEKNSSKQIQIKPTTGRPKIDKSQRRNIPLTFLLTQEESDRLSEKAGLASKGIFIRACLKEMGVL